MRTTLLRKLRQEAEENYETLFRGGLIIAKTVVDGYPYKEACVYRIGNNINKKRVIRNALAAYVKFRKYNNYATKD